MCLNTTEHEVRKFKQDHKNDDVLLVWKIYKKLKRDVWSEATGVYHRDGKTELVSRYSGIIFNSSLAGAYIQEPGVVESNRWHKVLDELGPDRDLYFSCHNSWDIERGIHVYTTRERAKQVLEDGQLDPTEYVVVCCHAKMEDFVGVEDRYKTAVFMKVSISPRNFRRATRGK